MKKALFFALDGLGGAERVMISIAKMLRENGWSVEFELIRTKNSQIESLSSALGPDFKHRVLIWDSQISFLKNLYSAIRSSDADVIFSSAMHINQRLLSLKPFFKKKQFIVRNDNYLYTISKVKRFTLKITYHLADKIIGQTEEMGRELIDLGLDPHKVEVIRNPIDTKLIENKLRADNPYVSMENKTIFVGCGRFSFQKGFDILLKAFSMVKKQIPDSILYLLGNYNYGEGEVLKLLNDIIEKEQLRDDVVMTGPVDNPYVYLNNANVFVLSSRWEGLPNVLLESLYLGLPSAATTCIPVIERLVQNGENGFLSNPEDPESLAQAMIECTKIKKKGIGGIDDNFAQWLSLFNSMDKKG